MSISPLGRPCEVWHTIESNVSGLRAAYDIDRRQMIAIASVWPGWLRPNWTGVMLFPEMSGWRSGKRFPAG